MPDTNYRSEAMGDACDTAREYEDTIVDALIDDGKASDDLLNDYGNGDSYHHESHVDKSYSLMEAAEILDALDEYEETDSGLWDGLEPRRAIEVQAACTYGNAVMSMFQDLIKTINDDSDIEDLLEEYTEAQEREEKEEEEAGEDEPIEDGEAADAPEAEEEEDEPKRSTDEIKAAILARVREIIEDEKPS